MATTAASQANPNPEVVVPPGNRRCRVRHRAQTPAYAALNSTQENPAVELQEIVNISEDGLALQVSTPLQEQEMVDLDLDLAETGAKIEVRGQVIWLGSGKAGIRFCEMPPDVQRKLQEWLFMNAMAACKYGAEEQRAASEPCEPEAAPLEAKPSAPDSDEVRTSFPGDYTAVLVALEAVRREVRLAGGGDPALQLIAERAMAFTRATGAAIALTADDELVCRATAGPDAPSLGMRFKAGEGFSGECVRSGQRLRCDDTEADARVDRSSCRALGVRSMLAMPLRGQELILGLLEVFSAQPNSFHAQDEVVLQRLAEMAAEAAHPAKSEEKGKRIERLASAARVDDEIYVEASEEPGPRRVSILQRLLFVGAGLAVIAAAVWVFAPLNSVRTRAARQGQGQQPAQTAAKLAGGPIVPQDFTGLRQLAEKGDPAAQFAVGAHYATGEDVPQDYAEALRWFTLAAEQGHVGAQATLGAYYWSGTGAPKDLNKAYFWAVLAQSGGDDASHYRVAFLASRMTHAQVVAAQQRADEWIKAHESASPPSR
jgi:putative methionine-R-sulfoxide reductase with GAF domain